MLQLCLLQLPRLLISPFRLKFFLLLFVFLIQRFFLSSLFFRNLFFHVFLFLNQFFLAPRFPLLLFHCFFPMRFLLKFLVLACLKRVRLLFCFFLPSHFFSFLYHFGAFHSRFLFLLLFLFAC